MINSVDPDQTPRSAASDQDLHCLLGHICLNTNRFCKELLLRAVNILRKQKGVQEFRATLASFGQFGLFSEIKICMFLFIFFFFSKLS